MSSSDDEASPAAAAAAASGEMSADELAQLQALDIRVGRIISCEQHPDADRCGTFCMAVGQ
jgi:tRNA-binding EMAP/Myf-like protein